LKPSSTPKLHSIVPAAKIIAPLGAVQVTASDQVLVALPSDAGTNEWPTVWSVLGSNEFQVDRFAVVVARASNSYPMSPGRAFWFGPLVITLVVPLPVYVWRPVPA
jgi:hypothetical protein